MSASYALTSTSASHALNADNAISASYALTASYGLSASLSETASSVNIFNANQQEEYRVLLVDSSGDTGETIYTTSSFTYNPHFRQLSIFTNIIPVPNLTLWNGQSQTGSIGLGYGNLTATPSPGTGYNIAIGYQTQESNLGIRNIGIGYQALRDSELNLGDSNYNIAIGDKAIYNVSNRLNTSSIALGYEALRDGGSKKDIAIGYQALFGGNQLFGGDGGNIAIGVGAMDSGIQSDGGNNIAIGTNTLSTLLTGNASNNVVIGTGAGELVSAGENNTFIGAFAGNHVVNGSNNTLIGYQAGTGIGGGSENIIIGEYVGKASGQDNNIAIGVNEGVPIIFSTGSTGFVGINTDNPLFRLDVNGTLAAELSTAADNSNIVSWNSATDEVQYVPSMSIDTGGFNPSGSISVANNTWLVSRDGFSLGAGSNVYNGYIEDISLGGSGGINNIILTIPRDTYAAIWIDYVTADSTYTNMRTQTFVAHWNNALSIEWTNTGPKDIGTPAPPSLNAVIVSMGPNTNVRVQATSTAGNQIMFGTYRLIRKLVVPG